MKYKIAFAGDLHKRAKDISTIKGYVNCCNLVQQSLIDMIIKNNITHFVSLGDWYDRGYTEDVSSALADTAMDYYMNTILNGNFYGVIGNHIRLKMDSNPELSLIQPHPVIKSRKQIRRDTQIIKTPNHILLGDLQVSLVHHDKNAESLEDYVISRLPGVRYHVACVHDIKFIPNSQLLRANLQSTNTTNTMLSRVLSNVDLCICGDIHTPLGLFDISEKTKMYIPGSLTNTTASISGRHGSIKMPVITVDTDNNKIKFEFLDFNLHIDTITFNEKAENKVIEKVKSIRGNNVKNLYENSVNIESYISNGMSSFNFGKFVKDQDYSSSDKEIIKSVIKNPDDIMSIIKFYYSGKIN